VSTLRAPMPTAISSSTSTTPRLPVKPAATRQDAIEPAADRGDPIRVLVHRAALRYAQSVPTNRMRGLLAIDNAKALRLTSRRPSTSRQSVDQTRSR
jgi:hypothetical protein